MKANLGVMQVVARQLETARPVVGVGWMPRDLTINTLADVTHLPKGDIEQSIESLVVFGYLDKRDSSEGDEAYRLHGIRLKEALTRSRRREQVARKTKRKSVKQVAAKQPQTKQTLLEKTLAALVPRGCKAVAVDAVRGPLKVRLVETGNKVFPSTMNQFRGMVRRIPSIEFTDNTRMFVRRVS